MTNPAFNLNEDGSAVDPAAFRAALKADSGRAKKLQVCPCRATLRGRLPVAVPVPPLRPWPSALLLHSSAEQLAVHALVTRARARRRPRGAAAASCDDSTAPESRRVSLLTPRSRDARQEVPELAHALLESDLDVMQAALRKVRARRRPRGSGRLTPSLSKLREASTQMSELDTAMLMNSMDRMRARCTTPRDVVAVYQALNKVRRRAAQPSQYSACLSHAAVDPSPKQIGLQYGPAFRLLTDVYVPDSVANGTST